jgi:hypothetical protein
MSNKTELIITALQERIGQLVANYETQIAYLRAELTEYANIENEKEKSLKEYSDHVDSLMEQNNG